MQYFVGDFHPWKAFAKYWIELDIWKYDPQITHWSGPHSLDKPEFYKVAVSCFRTFRDSFPLIPLPQLTVHVAMEVFLIRHPKTHFLHSTQILQLFNKQLWLKRPQHPLQESLANLSDLQHRLEISLPRTIDLIEHLRVMVCLFQIQLQWFLKHMRPRRDSNSQSSDSKSDALSIRPRGLARSCAIQKSFWKLVKFC